MPLGEDHFVAVASGLRDGTGVDPALVAKDYYLTRALERAGAYAEVSQYHLAFGGGTSLMKSGILERFSEDVDLYAIARSGATDTADARMAFSRGLLRYLGEDPDLRLKEAMRLETGSFSAKFGYPGGGSHPSLRPELSVEVTAGKTLRLPPKTIAVGSVAGDVLGERRSFSLPFVDPHEIAADKVSGLSWRTLRAGTGPVTDSTFIRHLHDLAAVQRQGKLADREFRTLALRAFNADNTAERQRVAGPTDLRTRLRDTTLALERSPALRGAYERFVNEVSFAPASRSIGYDQAVQQFKDVTRAIAPGIRYPDDRRGLRR